MDSKFYVSIEAARLLKEKGYDEQTKAAWNGVFGDLMGVGGSQIGAYQNSAYPDDIKIYSAPTKAEAIDWLESKGIVISVVYENVGIVGKKHYRSIINTFDKEGFESGLPIYLPSYDGDIRHYQTRLEAEEAAIIKALEL